MCGRYTLARSETEIAERFEVEAFSQIRIVPRFNIAPSQDVPVVMASGSRRVLALCKWGLIPSWVKDLSKARPLINARAETPATSLRSKRRWRIAAALFRLTVSMNGASWREPRRPCAFG